MNYVQQHNLQEVRQSNVEGMWQPHRRCVGRGAHEQAVHVSRERRGGPVERRILRALAREVDRINGNRPAATIENTTEIIEVLVSSKVVVAAALATSWCCP
jgi:hypothetical protein